MDEALLQRVGAIFHERWGRLGLDGLLPPERDHVLLWVLHVEVSNGGLDQYLSNSSGDFALETVDTLERYGLRDTAADLRLALDALPGGWCADREERNERLEVVPDRWNVFTLLTDEYHNAQDTDGNRPSPADGGVDEAILAAYLREGLIEQPTA